MQWFYVWRHAFWWKDNLVYPIIALLWGETHKHCLLPLVNLQKHRWCWNITFTFIIKNWTKKNHFNNTKLFMLKPTLSHKMPICCRADRFSFPLCCHILRTLQQSQATVPVNYSTTTSAATSQLMTWAVYVCDWLWLWGRVRRAKGRSKSSCMQDGSRFVIRGWGCEEGEAIVGGMVEVVPGGALTKVQGNDGIPWHWSQLS